MTRSGYPMIVFDSDPQSTSPISSEEEALVRSLFASFDTAWNHAALQERLRRAQRQSKLGPHGYSTLNRMTLFSIIWSAAKEPEFRPHQVVWSAMRVFLENSGVLEDLVARFNASASQGDLEQSYAQDRDLAASSVSRGSVERRQEERRARRARSSSVTVQRASSALSASAVHPKHTRLPSIPSIDQAPANSDSGSSRQSQNRTSRIPSHLQHDSSSSSSITYPISTIHAPYELDPPTMNNLAYRRMAVYERFQPLEPPSSSGSSLPPCTTPSPLDVMRAETQPTRTTNNHVVPSISDYNPYRLAFYNVQYPQSTFSSSSQPHHDASDARGAWESR
ncbi:hypothetical protein C8R42DRAFT_477609 [Lentinula raphanica]|nr:hypothetical protein C8R42DRAFT_477609 [Lentinula raphanica]